MNVEHFPKILARVEKATISELKTNVSLPPSHSVHKSLNHRVVGRNYGMKYS